MLQSILRRFVLMILLLFVISIVTFVLIQLPPGDYLSTYINQLEASGTQLSQVEVDNLKRLYGLDQPVYVQYLKWMRSIFAGKFGWSFQWQAPVSEVVWSACP